MKEIRGLVENKNIWYLYALIGALSIIMMYFQLIIGIIQLIFIIILVYFTFNAEKKLRKRTEKYVSTLSHRIKKVGDEALLEKIGRASCREGGEVRVWG